MKKFLLMLGASFATFTMSAQVIFYVNAPSPNEGNYDFSYAESASGWGVPDMTDPANAIEDTLVFVDDGTAGDTLGCNALINGAEIDGQIAVLYRGSCEFGLKAKNAQDAGAIGVVIINNIPGAPISMGGGADGPDVTIPVVMISDVDGALLKAEIEAQATTAFIGAKTGFYNNDIGFYPNNVLRAEHYANLQALSQSATEFEVQVGAWVFNYGSDPQTNVTLNATIDLAGSEIYNETSAPIASIPAGDSAYITLPVFSQPSYANGEYVMNYSVDMDLTDEFVDDNMVNANFYMSDTLFAYSHVDASTGEPQNLASYRGGSSVSSNTACINFSDPNGSRMAIKGMTFSASTSQNPTATSIEGEYVEIYAFRWEDVFVDINDAGFALDNLTEVASASYIYDADLQNENLFLPFEEEVALTDDDRYLFCISHYGENIYVGYDTDIDYSLNIDTYLQPMFPTESDGTWYGRGFGEDVVPALTVNMFTWAVGVPELPETEALSAYPNPATTFATIPLSGDYGNVDVTVMDINGKVLSTQKVTMEGNQLKVDVTTLATGTYFVKLDTEDQNLGTIRVMVTR